MRLAIFVVLLAYVSCSPTKKQPKVVGHWEYNDPSDGEKLVWVVDTVKAKHP